MKSYNFIKFILSCVIIFLCIFIIILGYVSPDAFAYRLFMGACVSIISGLVTALSVIKKDYNVSRVFALNCFVWLIYCIIQINVK